MNDDSSEELLRSLENSPELAQLQNRLARFNIFEILKLQGLEFCHSNLLAWLFDPRQNHGLQERFLKRWLQEVLRTPDLPLVDIDSYSFESVKVSREWNYIDLLVRIGNSDDKALVVAIENKVWSNQHSNQLARYRELITETYPDAQCVFILLSVSGEIPADRNFHIATYEQVLKALWDTLNDPSSAMDEEPHSIIKQYIEIIRSRLMPNSEIEKLARSIYAKHKEALDLIFEYRPDTFLRAVLVKEIQEIRNPIAFGVLPGGGKLIYLLPTSWDSPPNEKGNVVYLQLELGDKAVLTGRMGKGDASWEAWRQRAFEGVKQLNWSTIKVREKLTGEWPVYYEVVGPKLEIDAIDTQATLRDASKVTSWLREQMADSRFTEMVEMLAAYLKSHPGHGSCSATAGY